MSLNLRFAVADSLFFLAAVSVRGQSYQGGARGSVTDGQGAVIPNAQVNLTNEATTNARVSVTNSDGQYVFTAVEPATYTISIAARGFTKMEQKGTVVGAQQFLTLDFRLTIGSVTESVEVTAAPPLINVSDASNGQVINTQMLQNLPPLSRDLYYFERLDNSAVATNPSSASFLDQDGVANVSIAGGPTAANSYMVDGVPITDLNNRSVIVPSLEAINEMNLQAYTYDAEAGRTGGGTFNTVLKSGTNTPHGTLFGETRQTPWEALPYFFTPGPPVNVDYYNQAAAIGGPVTIPHIYNGKDKTFFHLSEEGFRSRIPTTGTFYVPTLAERTGDFSASSVKIYNPFAPLISCPAPYQPTEECRQPFPNNKVPANLINPVGQSIVNAMPLPNQPLSNYGQTDFVRTIFVGDRADEFIGKLDHQFLPQWYANFAYMHDGSKEPSFNTLGTFAADSSFFSEKVDAISQNNTVTLSPTTVLTAGYGFNRFSNNNIAAAGFSQTQLGFPASYVNSVQKNSFPQINMQTAASLGNNSSNSIFYSRSFVVGLAKSLGRHSVKVGYDFRSLSVDFPGTTLGPGTYSFGNIFSEELPNAGDISTGADVADLLLGTPSSGSVTTSTELRLNVHYQSAYVQDNFRATSRLTLNLGLRYEYELGVRERSNQFAVGFDPNVINPLTSTSGTTTKGGIEFAGQNGYPIHCCDYSHTMFSPRVGIAFALFSKTTVRSGYGVFHAPAYYAANSSVAPGYTQTNTYVASNDGNVTPANSLGNPFPNGLQPPSGSSQGYLTGVGSSLTVMDQNRRSPFVQQYSLDIQQELPSRMALKIGYVGSKGRNLQTSSNSSGGAANINQLQDQYLSLGSQLLSPVPNPYFNHGGTGVIGNATVASNQLLRALPEFASVNILTGAAKSLYNALNVKLQKDLEHGISLLATYTWSSNWDSAFGTNDNLNSGPNLPQDASNLKAEYSRALDDIPHRFALGSTVESPFGHGGNRLLDYLVGGWSLNTVGYIQTGAPLAVFQNSNNNASIGAGVQRPNLVGDPCYNGSPESRLNNYLNPAAFSVAPAFTYGNAPRTIHCLGPGLNGWDLSLFKDFHVERVTVQFRAEALNAFNTPQFRAPVTKFGAATFGQIQSTGNFPRYIQLGGRISF